MVVAAEELYIAKKQARWDAIVDEKDRWLQEQRKIRLETRDKSIPEIKQFYAGRSVLLTGGTGFIGQALLEKLLRSLPDLGKIYVIVRTKLNQSPDERIATMLKSDLFDLTRRQYPDALKKVVAISGNMSAKGLGLSLEDSILLQKEVSVVIHTAASVRFNDPLKTAILLNTRGTHELIEFCKGMPGLKSFVHVSTTYCNTDQGRTLEKVYPTPYNWRDIIALAENNSLEDLQAACAKILRFQPNTYTFTKQLSEKIVDDARDQLPVMILRLAVVTGTIAEPFPGWTGNINGPIGFSVGVVKGILRTLYIDSSVFLSYTPVDSCASIIIAAAWLRATEQRLSVDVSTTDVVNVSAEDLCDATYHDLLEISKAYIKKYNPRMLRAPRLTTYRNKWYYYFKFITSQLIFGVITDFILKLSGQKPQIIRVYRKIYYANQSLEYFMHNKFTNCTDDVWKLLSYITDPDFIPTLRWNLMEHGMNTVNYVQTTMFPEKPGSPLRTQIMEFIQTIQDTVVYVLYTWLGYKVLSAVYGRMWIGLTYPESANV